MFFMSLLLVIVSSITLSMLFIAFINVLPTNSIIAKSFIFNFAIDVVSVPFLLFVKMPDLPFYVYMAGYVIGLIAYPLAYATSYLLIAKKLPRIMRFNKIGFAFIIGSILSVLFLTFLVF